MVVDISVWLLGCSGWLIHCYGVARVLCMVFNVNVWSSVWLLMFLLLLGCSVRSLMVLCSC